MKTDGDSKGANIAEIYAGQKDVVSYDRASSEETVYMKEATFL